LEQPFGRELKPAVRSLLASRCPQFGQMKNGIFDRLQARG
jgi:hypothetical protein